MLNLPVTFAERLVRVLSSIPDALRDRPGRRLRRTIGILLLLIGVAGVPARGQINPQIGGGAQVAGSTAELTAGPGYFVQGSFPIAQQVSFVAGTAGTGYVLQGGDEATYILDGELSALVTFPSRSKSADYLMAGGGVRIPFRSESLDIGPTVHVGLGRLWSLRESTLFVELRPTLYVREAHADFALPIRGGVIF